MGKILCNMFYRFMVALAWIFGWYIILPLEIKERLSKHRKDGKIDETVN